MTVIVAPPPESRLTGGYRYNDEIAGRLAAAGRIRYREIPASRLHAYLADALRSEPSISSVVLDSLYLQHVSSGVLREIALPCGLLTHQVPTDQSALERMTSFDFYIAPSHYVAEVLKSSGVAAERIYICPPGISRFSTPPEHRSGRRRLTGNDGGETTFLTVSNDTETKNLAWLAETLSQLPFDRWRWHVVGSRSRHLSDALLHELGIAARTRLHGLLAPGEVRRLMTDAELFLHPSLSESYGMAVAEALSAGLPVVANRVGGIPEVTGDSACAVLCAADDRASWLEAIRSVTQESSRRRRLQRAARLRASELPEWSDAAQCFAAALSAIDKAHPGSRGSADARPGRLWAVRKDQALSDSSS